MISATRESIHEHKWNLLYLRGSEGTHVVGLPQYGGWRQRLTYGVLGASWHFLSWNRKKEIIAQEEEDEEDNFPQQRRIHLQLSPGLSIDCVRFRGPLLKLLSLLRNRTTHVIEKTCSCQSNSHLTWETNTALQLRHSLNTDTQIHQPCGNLQC